MVLQLTIHLRSFRGSRGCRARQQPLADHRGGGGGGGGASSPHQCELPRIFEPAEFQSFWGEPGMPAAGGGAGPGKRGESHRLTLAVGSTGNTERVRSFVNCISAGLGSI